MKTNINVLQMICKKILSTSISKMKFKCNNNKWMVSIWVWILGFIFIWMMEKELKIIEDKRKLKR